MLRSGIFFGPAWVFAAPAPDQKSWLRLCADKKYSNFVDLLD
jgi:hypothetical protein